MFPYSDPVGTDILARTGALDSMGSRSSLTWKFRTSSLGADQLSLEDPEDRRGTCLGCHINGAPVMKELFFPWNNWHSTASPATYLQRTAAPAERWPVAMAPRLTGEIVNFRQHGGLASAQILEKNIISAIRQFNTRRINIALKRRDDDGNLDLRDGQLEVMDAKRLLRHLFVTTEFNITTAERKSGLHPFPEETTQGPAGDVVIPDSFFLNVNLIRGGGFSGLTGRGWTLHRQIISVDKLGQNCLLKNIRPLSPHQACASTGFPAKMLILHGWFPNPVRSIMT